MEYGRNSITYQWYDLENHIEVSTISLSIDNEEHPSEEIVLNSHQWRNYSTRSVLALKLQMKKIALKVSTVRKIMCPSKKMLKKPYLTVLNPFPRQHWIVGPRSVNTFGIIGTKLRLEKYLQDASAGFALLEWTPCPISTATQETCIKMIIIPSPKKEPLKRSKQQSMQRYVKFGKANRTQCTI